MSFQIHEHPSAPTVKQPPLPGVFPPDLGVRLQGLALVFNAWLIVFRSSCRCLRSGLRAGQSSQALGLLNSMKQFPAQSKSTTKGKAWFQRGTIFSQATKNLSRATNRFHRRNQHFADRSLCSFFFIFCCFLESLLLCLWSALTLVVAECWLLK